MAERGPLRRTANLHKKSQIVGRFEKVSARAPKVRAGLAVTREAGALPDPKTRQRYDVTI
jgi:hypothetical protein